jgi:hypothetical protein
MGIFGRQQHYDADRAQYQAAFDQMLVESQTRLNQLYEEQRRFLQENLNKTNQLEQMREDIICRQLRLVEQWEQLYTRIERIVGKWESKQGV